jgi:hypothetical protein
MHRAQRDGQAHGDHFARALTEYAETAGKREEPVPAPAVR